MKLINFMKKNAREALETRDFRKTASINVETDQLATLSETKLKNDLLGNRAVDQEWPAIETELGALPILNTAGGVNVGDRRAIYYLIRGLKCRNVLEIGTHIGASTTYAARALKANYDDGNEIVQLTTVDIEDVNSQADGAYQRVGQARSPRELLEDIKCENIVKFVAANAEDYLKNGETNEAYDLIFLDGSHAAASVYREIPLALKKLRQGGLILLHDFYPNCQPLWKNSAVIRGPFKAVTRHIEEGASFRAIPLGELRWPTKKSSNITSLAVLARQPQ